LKEAGLLRLMEHAGKQVDDEALADAMKDKGLGTPATRADTIEKLVDRGYIQRSRAGSISATAHGIRIIDVLRKIPVEWITSPEMTGEMESSLLRVQRGDEPRENYMNAVIEQTRVMVERIKNHDRAELYQNEPSIGACTVCSGKIIETTLNYQCEKNEGRDKGCSFVFWKDTSGRWFDQTTAQRLLENRQIEDLHGFFNRSGEPYVATVKISDEGKVEFIGGGEASSSATDEEVCACPLCDHGTVRIGQTNSEVCPKRCVNVQSVQKKQNTFFKTESPNCSKISFQSVDGRSRPSWCWITLGLSLNSHQEKLLLMRNVSQSSKE
jgi:DNA topoisomerase-3